MVSSVPASTGCKGGRSTVAGYACSSDVIYRLTMTHLVLVNTGERDHITELEWSENRQVYTFFLHR